MSASRRTSRRVPRMGVGTSTGIRGGYTDYAEHLGRVGNPPVVIPAGQPHLFLGRDSRLRPPAAPLPAHTGPALEHPAIISPRQTMLAVALCVSTLKRFSVEATNALRSSPPPVVAEKWPTGPSPASAPVSPTHPREWGAEQRRAFDELAVSTLRHIPCPECGSMDTQCPDSAGGMYTSVGRSIVRATEIGYGGYRMTPMVHRSRKALANQLMDEHRGLTRGPVTQARQRSTDWRSLAVYP